GAPGKEAPRAEPATSQQSKDNDGGDDPGQPGLLRRDHGGTAGPDWYTLAVADGQSIFRYTVFLIQPEIAGNGSDESSIEGPPGELIPLFVFDGLQEARGNARGGGNL